MRNFVRLTDAPVVRIPSADDAAFERVAEDLVKPLKAAA
jgi:hypothetical protein